MTRRSAAKRLVAGLLYVPLYVFVLFPIAFVVAITGGVIEIAWSGVTGRPAASIPAFVDRVLSYTSGNLRWITTGRGSFEWLP